MRIESHTKKQGILDFNEIKNKNADYKAIDLFAGVGGIRLGFEKAFRDKVGFVFSSEIDKYAKQFGNSVAVPVIEQ